MAEVVVAVVGVVKARVGKVVVRIPLHPREKERNPETTCPLKGYASSSRRRAHASSVITVGMCTVRRALLPRTRQRHRTVRGPNLLLRSHRSNLLHPRIP